MGKNFEERFLAFLSIINITDDDYRKNIADFAFKRSEEYIKSFCNIDNLPKELFGVHKNVAIDFFNSIENSITEKGHIKSIKEGLVTMEFFEKGFGSSEILNSVEKYICEITPFRKMRW